MDENQIEGVYYERKLMEAGTMGTKRTHDTPHDLHYFCKSTSKGEVALYFLKPTGQATSMIMDTITREAFDSKFKDCSTHKCELKPVSDEDKKKEAAQAKVSMGQHHMDKKEYNAAAFEFGQAIKQDEKNLKAHLGKGKAHLSLGDVEEAKKSFESMSEIDDLYEKDNKHIFNEYGIELRRGEMYDMAIENYKKAISIDDKDEALYFNIARAYQQSGRMQDAVKNLDKALSIEPDFTEAKALKGVLEKSALK
ncbi:hypothetical protein MNBD_NITROSPINAE03-2087 [hydrothermal vent metagenome]|uniref:Uncharacterized protein n=1 Tax=hydrothermal vent metagenome TaxID=652676 RepID=A0A3B1CH90_9ZZZZ